MGTILFKRDKIIKEVEEMVKAGSVQNIRMRSVLVEMLRSYEKLENQFRKIIKISDKQQAVLLSEAEFERMQLTLMEKERLKDKLHSQEQTIEKIERLHKTQVAINNLLQTSVESVSLADHLSQALNAIMTLPWLTIEHKGSISLWDKSKQKLVLVAHQNLSLPLLSICSQINLGDCLCGLAAETQKTVFADRLDERHNLRFDGIPDHGHYCIPILLGEELLGVLNLYLIKGHVRNPEEETLLLAMANTIAVLIKRRQLEGDLKERAEFDPLTGLPNRTLLYDSMARAVSMAKRKATEVVLMFIDLDRFKIVNDTMGHDAGDELLQETSRRITSCVRSTDVVARFGGDEFIVILPKLTHLFYAEFVARRIMEELSKPFALSKGVADVSASIGIAVFPHDASRTPANCSKTRTPLCTVPRKRGVPRFGFLRLRCTPKPCNAWIWKKTLKKHWRRMSLSFTTSQRLTHI